MHHVLKVMAFSLLGAFTGCASIDTVTAPRTERIGLNPRTLSSGDCGLFVWKADQAKTFILFADQKSAVFYQNGIETAIMPAAKLDIPTERQYIDSNGQKMSLSLREAQTFQESTRYKSGRITSLDENSWEVITPVVGLFSCQP